MAFGRKKYLMWEFDYSKLKERTWDNEIITCVAQIHEIPSGCRLKHDVIE